MSQMVQILPVPPSQVLVHNKESRPAIELKKILATLRLVSTRSTLLGGFQNGPWSSSYPGAYCATIEHRHTFHERVIL